MKKDNGENKDKKEEEEQPIAILRNRKGKFIAYIYSEDSEFFDIDIEMSDYEIERLD